MGRGDDGGVRREGRRRGAAEPRRHVQPPDRGILSRGHAEMCARSRILGLGLGVARGSGGGPGAGARASGRGGHAFPAAPVVETRDGHAWAASEGFGACGDFANGAGVGERGR